MRLSRLGYAFLITALAVGGARAGGFSRGTADTDILFEPGDFNFRAGATVVVPSQKVRHDTPLQAPGTSLVGSNYLDTYVIPSAAIKFKVAESLSCAGTFTDALGANSSYSLPYGGSGKLAEEFRVSEFGATCALFLDAGPGRFAFLAGGFVETLDYSLSAEPLAFGGQPLEVRLDGEAYGWRAGVAYEIPDIALRAQLLYRSGTNYGAAGSATSPALAGTVPAVGIGETPQSVELKLQSGIAPGWLAFGSVKWMDWSVNETLIVDIGLPTQLVNQYHWRDGWTVTAGIGHAFSQNVSGLVSLQWDRGVATGYDLRTDKWLLAAGVGLKDDIGGELRLGAGVTYLTSAEITRGKDAGTAVDSGWVGILSASYSVTW